MKPFCWVIGVQELLDPVQQFCMSMIFATFELIGWAECIAAGLNGRTWSLDEPFVEGWTGRPGRRGQT